MSQYQFPPPPYSPPMVDPRAWGISLSSAPGRSASIWQFILGGLIFLFGSCIGGMVLAIPDSYISQMLSQQHVPLPPVENMTPVQEIRLGCTYSSVIMLTLGGALLILAFFVRRAGRRSIVFSIVINCLVGLFTLVDLGSVLSQIGGNPMAIFSLPLICGFLALCVITIVKLFAALNSAGSAQTQAMQQAYYWMMQYQQTGAAPGQGGYGYSQSATTTPPVAPPPPQQFPPPPPPPEAH